MVSLKKNRKILFEQLSLGTFPMMRKKKRFVKYSANLAKLIMSD